MNPWHLLKSGAEEPAINMAVDEVLMQSGDSFDAPVLRFYGWRKPAATFGYFQKYADVAQWTALRPLIRRPTGGGLVPHDADWTYSLVFPRGHTWYALKAKESYRRLHAWLRESFAFLKIRTDLAPLPVPEGPGQCFVGAEENDLLLEGRKIAGAAQRRTKQALLIQGSIQNVPPGVDRSNWERAMIEVSAAFGAPGWIDYADTCGLLEKAELLAESKYTRDSYNRMR